MIYCVISFLGAFCSGNEMFAIVHPPEEEKSKSHCPTRRRVDMSYIARCITIDIIIRVYKV